MILDVGGGGTIGTVLGLKVGLIVLAGIGTGGFVTLGGTAVGDKVGSLDGEDDGLGEGLAVIGGVGLAVRRGTGLFVGEVVGSGVSVSSNEQKTTSCLSYSPPVEEEKPT